MTTLQEALDALPKTSRGIAAYMRRHGIKGLRGEDDSCPIANYLKSACNNSEFIKVGGYCAYAYEHRGVTMERGGLSKGAQRFIRSFDQARYPDLVVGDA